MILVRLYDDFMPVWASHSQIIELPRPDSYTLVQQIYCTLQDVSGYELTHRYLLLKNSNSVPNHTLQACIIEVKEGLLYDPAGI